MYKIFGIKNCDTIKKTLKWFKDKDLPFSFHDYRIDGIDKILLEGWVEQMGLEVILNKKSTTWRELDPETQKSLSSKKKALRLMAEQTSIIKRPIITKNGKVVAVGFNESELREKMK